MIIQPPLIHGRETCVEHYGEEFVMKRPLPHFNAEQKKKWLKKQHNTRLVIEKIRAVGNTAYNIPRMHHIKDEEFSILEDRAHGIHLDRETYRQMPRRHKYELKHKLASFMADMSELKQSMEAKSYKISEELKIERLENFIGNKMGKSFHAEDVRFMEKIYKQIVAFQYDTVRVWSHGDLNARNIFYNPKNGQVSFIDFAEANHKIVYRDIFSPMIIDLGIAKPVYEIYCKLHDKSGFHIYGPNSGTLKEIMKYRAMVVCLRRIIHASDGIRLYTESDKGKINNKEKIQHIGGIIAELRKLDKQRK
ncbi:MAG: aminoglycoside phosphotransferase family protein [Alphaproteobacteria bacterium]|nr:aminoglycoside phosphotransferase family protein [Alphaproteobacteria bacterium]